MPRALRLKCEKNNWVTSLWQNRAVLGNLSFLPGKTVQFYTIWAKLRIGAWAF
jgi:hypothetical protein